MLRCGKFSPDYLELVAKREDFENPNEPIVDIVAFKMSDPTRFWLRLGQGVILGLHSSRLATLKQEPILVHPHPLAWLRDDCQGCSILNWNADLISRLDGFGVLVQDVATGKRLERAFHQHINIPTIKIEGVRHAAA